MNLLALAWPLGGGRLTRLAARSLLLAAVALVSGFPPAAQANRLQVGPTLIEMAPGKQAEAVWLSNTGNAPIAVQIRVFRWDQDRNENQLAPTDEVVVSPTQTTIPQGQRQLVRILRRGPPNTEERAFRIIVDELSSGTGGDTPASGLQFRLRYSIPVFIAAPADHSRNGPDLAVALESPSTRTDDSVLVISNSGRRRAQLAEVTLDLPPRSPVTVSAGLLGYVLPGRTMRWRVKAITTDHAQAGELKVRVNAEPSMRSLPVRVQAPY